MTSLPSVVGCQGYVAIDIIEKKRQYFCDLGVKIKKCAANLYMN